MMRRRIGQQLEDRQRGGRLAPDGFADQRHGLALADVERGAIDRDHVAAAGAERNREIADGEEGVSGHLLSVQARSANVFRGSKASRTASPMKISSDSMIATAKKPVRPSHGACTLALPCDNSSPSEGEPGGN